MSTKVKLIALSLKSIMRKIICFVLMLVLYISNTFLQKQFANSCDPYFEWEPNQSCPEPSSAPPNCIARILGFTDCFSGDCPPTADSNSPTSILFKTTTWRLCWPGGHIREFASTSRGECMTTQNSCCGSYAYERCWPSFNIPETGNGYFTQTTYRSSARLTRVEFCNWTPCSKYNVFGGCSTRAQGDIHRTSYSCCIGSDDNPYGGIDSDHDGWCSDRDCDDLNRNIHTGCTGGGGGGQACFTPGPFDTPPPYSCDPPDLPCADGRWSTS
jgi:hypothetical protein